jgi:transcriptional regulator GlxA family with amidase domain
VSVAEVAHRVGLTQKRLTEAFRHTYGITVYDFSVTCRMERALKLLRESGASVDEVSQAVGYSQPTSFATAFRRHFGFRPLDVKPRKTRKQLKPSKTRSV